jgi:hypothetical protein
MGSSGKSFVLISALIMAVSSVSLLMVKPVSSQSIPTPSVPQFTVKYVDNSYDVPPVTTTTTDPYTGKNQNVTIQEGYYVDNQTMIFTVKNQPFTPYNDSSGRNIEFYYNFRYKGHFGTVWSYYPFNLNGFSTGHYGGIDFTQFTYYPASDSDFTVTSIDLSTLGIPDNGQVDFQVQAQFGYITDTSSAFASRVYGAVYSFTGQSSDWSNTQTVTVGQTSPASQTSTSTLTSTPTVPEFPSAVIGIVVVLAAASAAILFCTKRKNCSKT